MTAVKHKATNKILDQRDFASLMAVYERNFRLLEQLLPDLDLLPDGLTSTVTGSLDLHLEVLERCKYTTRLRLTYYFPVNDGHVADPDLTINIYHDAGQAEAMACRKKGFMSVEHNDGNKRPFIDCRWESNLFVEKWLRYSIDQGHIFSQERFAQGQVSVYKTTVNFI